MTVGGWICMLLAISVVSGLFIWCCYKVLTSPAVNESVGDKTYPTA